MILSFDENFLPPIADVLRVLGYDARHVLGCVRRGTPDVELFQIIARENGVLVTHDKKIRRKAHEREALRSAAHTRDLPSPD